MAAVGRIPAHASATTLDVIDKALNGVPSGAGIDLSRRRPLTPRQDEILSFIRDAIQAKGFPPTLREIGRHFHIRSTNGVNDHLKALERKGYLLRSDLLSRGMRVVGDPVVEDVGSEHVAGVAGDLQAENDALRELVKQLAGVLDDVPQLTPQMVLILGDVRRMLSGRRRHQ